MGLDMYLTATRRMSVHLSDEQKNIDSCLKSSGLYGLSEDESSVDVSTSLMYWRKANHIHKWFVDNIQDSVDDCRKYHLPLEKLKELKYTCDKVIEDPKNAGDLLPPGQGFFFGSSYIDDYYLDAVVYTSKRIEKILEYTHFINKEFIEIYYQSSW